VLKLDPGMAFGTGLHPTTQLCVGFIEDHVKPDMQVLDLGCGSGILAIAAARLGAQVLALDTDPIAVTATQENVDRNEVADRVRAAEGSLGAGVQMGHWLYPNAAETPTAAATPADQPVFDVIVANIIARVLAALAHDMAGALLPGGTLIASGIIAEREAEVAAAFAEAGLAPRQRQQDGDWVALVYQKTA